MKHLTKMISALFCLVMLTIGQQAAFAQTTAEIAGGNCKSCADACQKTLDYCNTKKGKYGEASVTNALKDCITACKATSDFLNRGSAYLDQKAAALTVDACNNCAKSCDKFNTDNQMAACANECRKAVGNLGKISSGAAK